MKLIKGILCILLVILCNGPIFAQYNNDGAFLEKALGPTPISLGRAVTSIANDTYAIYINPAGLSQQDHKKIGVMMFQAYEANFFSGEFITPSWGRLHVGFGIVHMKISDALETQNINGFFQDTGSFNSTGTGLMLSMSHPLTDNSSLGITGKYIQKTLSSYQANGVGLDIGLLYHTSIMEKPVHIGIAIQNIIKPKLTWDSGIAHTIPQTIAIGAHTTLLNDKLLTSLTVQKKEARSTTLHGGLSYKLNSTITLQAGYDDSSFSIGSQLHLEKLNLSYSMSMPHPTQSKLVENISRLSLGYSF